MIGIILAGGKGSRLLPLTVSINKHLLPIYNKPMIYYPITTLILLGCKKIIIVINKKDRSSYKKCINSLGNLGVKFVLQEQGSDLGIPSAILCAQKYISSSFYVILGDNLFFGNNFINDLKKNKNDTIICVKKVKEPKGFGILYKDNNNQLKVFEKPSNFIGNLAVTGIYRFPKKAVNIIQKLKKSSRNETEVSDLINTLIGNKKSNYKVIKLNRGTIWLDAGTFDSLAQCTEFVKIIYNRQGQDFGVPEEAAYEMRNISKTKLRSLNSIDFDNNYSEYIDSL